MRKIYFIFSMLSILWAVGARAEANLPPPEEEDIAPLVLVKDENNGAKPTAPESYNELTNKDYLSDTGVNQQVGVGPAAIMNKIAPVSQSERHASTTVSTLVWDHHSGGAYTRAVECKGNLYIAADRLIHVWDRDSFAEKGLFDAGAAIDKLDCRLVEDRLFILTLLRDPKQLLILEDRTSSPALAPQVLEPQAGRVGDGILQLRHAMPIGGELKVFADAIFVKGARAAIPYELTSTGMMQQQGVALSLAEGDDFYPFGRFIYVYRREQRTLEVWDKERGETLASIGLGGNPSLLTLLAEPTRRGAEGRALEPQASLYLAMAQEGQAQENKNGETLYAGLYRIPIRVNTGLFAGEGREIALPAQADALVLDEGEFLLYLRAQASGSWQAFDLAHGALLEGQWGEGAWPVPGQGSHIAFISDNQVQDVQMLRQENKAGGANMEWRVLRSREGLQGATQVVVDPSAHSFYFSARASATPSVPQWFASPLAERAEASFLGGEPAMGEGRLVFVAPYWFWHEVATGKLYASNTLSPPIWTELVLPPVLETAPVHSRYTIAPLADGVHLGIWAAFTSVDAAGDSHGAVALYALALPGKTSSEAGDTTGEDESLPQETPATTEFAIEGPLYRFTQLSEAYEVLPFTPDGRYVAVAAGGEQIVLLAQADRSEFLERIHRKSDPSPLVRCEQLLISPSRRTLVLAFRDERNPADPKAVFNFYDISSEFKFPLYLSQVTDIPLARRSGRLEIPSFSFVHSESLLVMALGEHGLGLLSLANSASPTLVLETFAGEAIVDVSIDASGERLCAAASDAGVLCGRFK